MRLDGSTLLGLTCIYIRSSRFFIRFAFQQACPSPIAGRLPHRFRYRKRDGTKKAEPGGTWGKEKARMSSLGAPGPFIDDQWSKLSTFTQQILPRRSRPRPTRALFVTVVTFCVLLFWLLRSSGEVSCMSSCVLFASLTDIWHAAGDQLLDPVPIPLSFPYISRRRHDPYPA